VPEPEGFQDKLRGDLDVRYDKLLEMLDGALTSEANFRVEEPCSKCDCKHFRYIKVPDYKTKLAVAEFFSNRVHGRPGQAEAEGSQGVTVSYRVEVVDGS
jgi:hypothetical protein